MANSSAFPPSVISLFRLLSSQTGANSFLAYFSEHAAHADVPETAVST